MTWYPGRSFTEVDRWPDILAWNVNQIDTAQFAEAFVDGLTQTARMWAYTACSPSRSSGRLLSKSAKINTVQIVYDLP
jgi:hypothetical protein